MYRPCIEQGCPRLTTGTRCDEHRKAKDRARGTRQARGYGADHQHARAELATLLPARCGGGVGAPYCGRWITPDDRWVAAHRVDGAPEYGYVHAHPECNERAKRRTPGGVDGLGKPNR
jgi:hypothetical protein